MQRAFLKNYPKTVEREKMITAVIGRADLTAAEIAVLIDKPFVDAATVRIWLNQMTKAGRIFIKERRDCTVSGKLRHTYTLEGK